ncbi:hypothetical protein ERX37_05545 [Macrococcus hajekii]|uniref:Uncharacterized protein n=1 Tax=Macrococcus hajekii TaxID=198482 RepID=A0A4V3BDV4_9STAP|nr:hypothetical protein [Macrococcus hajekii]TDM01674.1 hypothetical protein ERX37_05545 [Macrococcus hajekii]GGB13279.1 hypothetical protein GCM10007190_21730 [Macrococcus hajekii]
MLPYIGFGAMALINLYFAYYYILADGRGELTWMGFVSLFVSILFFFILVRYHQSMKRQQVKNFNGHIKTDDDRLIK